MAGFVDVQVAERADWRALEHALWTEAVTTPTGDDPAMPSFQAEGRSSLAAWNSLRRMYATATA